MSHPTHCKHYNDKNNHIHTIVHHYVKILVKLFYRIFIVTNTITV